MALKNTYLALLIAVTNMFCVGASHNTNAADGDKTRVLYLGDSQSIGAFGRTLDASMRKAGLDVFTVVAGGASPYYWLKEYQSIPSSIGYWEKFPDGERRLGYIRAVPKLQNLLAELRPNIVVVQTGINLYATLRSKRDTKEENRKEVRTLIDQMCFAITKSDAKSYWILPPHSHERKFPAALQTELRSIISDVVKQYEGEVYESQKYTKYTDPYPANDGIHYGSPQATEWAEKVASHFNSYMKIAPKKSRPELVRALPLQTATSSHSTSLALRIKPKQPSKNTSVAKAVHNSDPVDLVLRLVEKSEIKEMGQLEYANALGVFEYEVINDKRGNYKYDRIRVAHGIMFQRKPTSSAKRKIGETIDLTLVPLSRYPNLKTWQTVDDLRPNLDLPIYTPKLN